MEKTVAKALRIIGIDHEVDRRTSVAALAATAVVPLVQKLRASLVDPTPGPGLYELRTTCLRILRFIASGRAGFDEVQYVPREPARALAILDAGGGGPCVLTPPRGACEAWRRAMVDHLRANRDAAVAFLERECGDFLEVAAPAESTYLLWLDARKLGASPGLPLLGLAALLVDLLVVTPPRRGIGRTDRRAGRERPEVLGTGVR